jgi:phospholipid N-methyltransferase
LLKAHNLIIIALCLNWRQYQPLSQGFVHLLPGTNKGPCFMFNSTCGNHLLNCLGGAWSRIRTSSTFLKEFAQAPSHVGSICPSSRALTAALIQASPLNQPGLIIDLGAGSGIVSEELIKAGIEPERLLAIEISPGFAEVFARRCPGVPLFIEDARSLSLILNRLDRQRPISSIISSLPLRIMPSDLVREIMAELKQVLAVRGGSLIQYTYAWWMRYPLAQYGFKPSARRIVLKNIPPARVESYEV